MSREEYLEYQKRYREEHKEELREKDKIRYEKNKERYKEYRKEYRKKNKERIKAKRRETYKKTYVSKLVGRERPVEDVFEVWADINENYSVSNYGRVWSEKSKKLIGAVNSIGYIQVIIDNKSYLVHRLVAEKFIPNPDNLPEIDHIDTDRTNNVVTNLRWTDRKGNQNNPITKERFKESNKGKGNLDAAHKAKRKRVVQYSLTGEFVNEYDSAKTAEIETGIDRGGIGHCCRNYRGVKTAGGFIWKFKDAA